MLLKAAHNTLTLPEFLLLIFLKSIFYKLVGSANTEGLTPFPGYKKKGGKVRFGFLSLRDNPTFTYVWTNHWVEEICKKKKDLFLRLRL